MFVEFFYDLRSEGIPITPTAFLRLQKALDMGLVRSLEDLYIAARAIMIKSERFFDLYDRLFATYFYGAEFVRLEDEELEAAVRALLNEWLKSPEELALVLGLDPEKLKEYDPEELVKYFLDRLKEQTEAHHGGDKWIGTKGTSPVGHSGQHPGGMRVGGASMGKSAIKVAMERRWKDYAFDGPIDTSQMAEALKRLRNLKPVGPEDELNIDETIYQTVKKGGEIEIIFDRRKMDKLKVFLMMDNGGWSMDPYIEQCRTLFKYASSTFKEVRFFYFHNCIYDRVWEDPQRFKKQYKTKDFSKEDSDTRLIIVGDASMAPYELVHESGMIEYGGRQSKPGIFWLQYLNQCFPHSAWLNPKKKSSWEFTAGDWTIAKIRTVFPMFDLTLDGLEGAVKELAKK